MIETALKIIEKAFKGKVDKAGEPYINHLQRVRDKCYVVDHVDHVEAIKTAALLHDLLEDCPDWNEEILRVFFPSEVVDTVVALTKKPEHEQKYDYYIDQVMKNDWAVQIKKFDLEDNMNITRLKEVLTYGDFQRLRKYHCAYLRITNERI